MMRCVFDSNAVVSAALIRDSLPRQALSLALNRGTLLTSEDFLKELQKY